MSFKTYKISFVIKDHRCMPIKKEDRGIAFVRSSDDIVIHIVTPPDFDDDRVMRSSQFIGQRTKKLSALYELEEINKRDAWNIMRQTPKRGVVFSSGNNDVYDPWEDLINEIEKYRERHERHRDDMGQVPLSRMLNAQWQSWQLTRGRLFAVDELLTIINRIRPRS